VIPRICIIIERRCHMRAMSSGFRDTADSDKDVRPKRTRDFRRGTRTPARAYSASRGSLTDRDGCVSVIPLAERAAGGAGRDDRRDESRRGPGQEIRKRASCAESAIETRSAIPERASRSTRCFTLRGASGRR